MNRRRVTDNEIKLTVLQALQALGPVTDQQLTAFMALCDLLNWFDMKLGLLDLEDEGMVIRQAHPSGPLIRVTEAGEFCLKQFAGRIPASRKERIAEIAKREKKNYRNSQQAPVESFDSDTGGVWLQLRMIEESGILLDLSIRVPEKTPLREVERLWNEEAPDLYRFLLTRLELPAGEHAAYYMESKNASLTLYAKSTWEHCAGKQDEILALVRERVDALVKKTNNKQ